jgi:hypothetical protein
MQNFITQFDHTIRTQNAFYVHARDAKMSFVDTRDIATIATRILRTIIMVEASNMSIKHTTLLVVMR